jgi:hypothetical protein
MKGQVVISQQFLYCHIPCFDLLCPNGESVLYGVITDDFHIIEPNLKLDKGH